MNKDELEKSWADRGFSFDSGTFKVGDKVEDAVHSDKDELVFMESGKYEFTIGRETFIQEGNEEVLFPAGTRHSIKNIGAEESMIYFGYKSKTYNSRRPSDFFQ